MTFWRSEDRVYMNIMKFLSLDIFLGIILKLRRQLVLLALYPSGNCTGHNINALKSNVGFLLRQYMCFRAQKYFHG